MSTSQASVKMIRAIPRAVAYGRMDWADFAFFVFLSWGQANSTNLWSLSSVNLFQRSGNMRNKVILDKRREAHSYLEAFFLKMYPWDAYGWFWKTVTKKDSMKFSLNFFLNHTPSLRQSHAVNYPFFMTACRKLWGDTIHGKWTMSFRGFKPVFDYTRKCDMAKWQE